MQEVGDFQGAQNFLRTFVNKKMNFFNKFNGFSPART